MFDPRRWGLPAEAVNGLADLLGVVWQRFAHCFRTKTRDSGLYGYHYLSGLLRMEAERNFANIGRQTGLAGQNVQQFMSDSPWSAQPVLHQIQEEIAAKPELARGGVLILDESADEKAGEKTVGAARQYNGRVGKVDVCQVGVFLAYANIDPSLPAPVWTWVDGELFLPEHCFSAELAPRRLRLGILEERKFASKAELGWQMIERVIANQARRLPFEFIAFDDNYGKLTWLRRNLNQAGQVYMADIATNTQVYLSKPHVGVPAAPPCKRGRPYKRQKVLSDEKPLSVEEVAQREDTHRERVRVRACERGEVNDEFAARRVWTIRDGGRGVPDSPEWLVIRWEANGRLNCSLSNAVADTPLERLAWMKCQRYFVERANQDAKSELGWDDFRAQKYRAWEHELALTALASWFVAEAKLNWARQHPPDPALTCELGVEVLPALSMANVREMLRAAMPLPQLTREKATDLVVKHLVNRARARKSRLKHRYDAGPSP